MMSRSQLAAKTAEATVPSFKQRGRERILLFGGPNNKMSPEVTSPGKRFIRLLKCRFSRFAWRRRTLWITKSFGGCAGLYAAASAGGSRNRSGAIAFLGRVTVSDRAR